MRLTADKFVEDTLERNMICDLIGGRISLIHEYGENKFKAGEANGKKEGISQIIVNLLKSGDTPETLAEKTNMKLEDILKIKKENNL